MASAYTPGLRVSASTVIEKLRRLPLKGEVLVQPGQAVGPGDVVARTQLPGLLHRLKVAEAIGVDGADLPAALQVKEGDVIQVGDLLAETKGLFGRFFRAEYRSPAAGIVEIISTATGTVGLRQPPTPVERTAYVRGVVKEVLPGEGVVVSCSGALVQGIFGVGGERLGEIAAISPTREASIEASMIRPEHAGKVLVAGGGIGPAALWRAAEVGVVGIVCGGIVDRDLMDYLAEALGRPGFDIGVAITGQEAIPFSLIVTEGFGEIVMAERTFRLLTSLAGQIASINGATQIRAGVIRPEVIVPHAAGTPDPTSPGASGSLAIGSPIRIIREPYFGLLGTVAGLPSAPAVVGSGAHVRVLEAKLDSGETVTVPRANVELIETS